MGSLAGPSRTARSLAVALAWTLFAVLGSCSSRRGRQLKEPGRQLGEAGRASSFVYHEGDTVIQLQNVQLVEDGFIYYHDGSSPLPPADLSSILVHQFWEGLTAGRQITVVTADNVSQQVDKCIQWIEKPTILYTGPEWDFRNLYHYLLDNLIPLFTTVIRTGLFDLSTFNRRQGLPSSEEANLLMIHMRSGPLVATFGTLFDHITPDRWLWPHGVGSCFSNLVLGVDNSLRTYVLTQDPARQLAQQEGMQRFQAFALKAQYRSAALRYGAAPARPRPAAHIKQRRAVIGWVSRPRSKYNSRAVVNEAEVLAALAGHYGQGAAVQALYFNGSLTQAMQDVAGVDVLVGMHGAGLTNMMWMRPKAAVVQLTPYGWELGEGRHQSVDLYRQLAYNMNCSHHLWVNERAEHAFFVEHDFEVEQHPFRPHPDPAEPIPGPQWPTDTVPRYWFYQDTFVDVATLLPVVDEAMRSVGAWD